MSHILIYTSNIVTANALRRTHSDSYLNVSNMSNYSKLITYCIQMKKIFLVYACIWDLKMVLYFYKICPNL